MEQSLDSPEHKGSGCLMPGGNGRFLPAGASPAAEAPPPAAEAEAMTAPPAGTEANLERPGGENRPKT